MHSEGVLSDLAGEVVVKPCLQAEIDFYESTAAYPDFKYYLPDYYGKLNLSLSPSAATNQHVDSLASTDNPQIASSLSTDGQPTVASHQAWAPSNGGALNTDDAIALENVAGGFEKPNILDVKLGARLWADDAPLAKRQKLEKAAAETTSLPLGFRIAGMKTWQGISVNEHDALSLDGYRIYDKAYGRSLNVETIRQGFEDYFIVERAGITKHLAHEIIQRFLKDLRGLQNVVKNQESRIYSASLLFVYEGDGKALQESLNKEKILESEAARTPEAIGAEDDESDDEELQVPKVQAIKLIDFAHAKWTPGEGPDENLLHGVRNVIRILEQLIE